MLKNVLIYERKFVIIGLDVYLINLRESEVLSCENSIATRS